MLDCVFLVPIDHRGIQGKLMNNYLNLQSWCHANNSQILTVNGLFLNFARNYLATGGKGFVDPTPPDAEWLFWIDSDVDFSIEQVEQLLSVPPKNKFVSGWYRSDYSDHAMVGNWDEDYFRKQHYMPFLSVEWLDKIGKEEPHKLVEVDWCGFGFTKIHRSIFEEMEYPYFPLNHVSIPNCDDKRGGKFDLEELSFEDVSFCKNCYETTKIKPLVVPKIRLPHLKSFFV
jgi:hypothetical protein|tara:strand:- start:564 stop:1250 length:687 start_codon:yes stop_codon:yes gene_type:complete